MFLKHQLSQKEVGSMPGFDGTGPRGMGPMTGGGRGFCARSLGTYGPAYCYGMGYVPFPGHGSYPRFRPQLAGPMFGLGRGGMPYGGGRGRVFGGGRGFWRSSALNR
jgi:hypothetical protein